MVDTNLGSSEIRSKDLRLPARQANVLPGFEDWFVWFNFINCHENPVSMSLHVTFAGSKDWSKSFHK